uniref:Glucuronosyltransferase n=1 Tax=Rhabditophanes sp. KR3021 TaxID=114890 RepID=A0AC35U6X3_9BILA
MKQQNELISHSQALTSSAKDFLISTFFENPVLQPGQSFTKDQVLHLQSMYNEYKERLEQKKVLMGQREAAEKQSSNAQNQSSGDQHQSSRDQYHSLNNQSSGLRQFASAIQQQTLSSAGIQKQSSSSGLQQQLNQLQSPILPMQSTSSQQLSMVQQQSYMVQQPPPIVQHRSTVQQQPMIQHSSLYNQLPVVNNFQQQRETSSAPTISKKMSEEMQNSFFRNYIHPSNGCSSGGSFTSSVSRSVDNKVQKEASCSVSKNSKVIAKTITHKDKQLKKDVAKMTKNKSKVELSEMTFESVKIENQTNFHDAQNKVNVPYNESLTKIIFTPPQKVLEAPKPYDSQVLSLPKNQISSSNCFMVPTKEDERCTKTVKSNKGKVYYSYKSKVSDEMLRESMYIDQEALKLLNEPKVMKIPKLPRQRTAQQKPVASPKKTRGPYKTGKNVKDRSTISNQTRQAHNELEKNRRANLRNHLEALKNILPPEVAASRPTTLTLLTKAKEFLVAEMRNILLLLLAIIPVLDGAKVLLMPSSLFPVHRYVFSTLADELVNRNHEVYWFEYGLKKPTLRLSPKVHEVFIQVSTEKTHILDSYLHRNNTNNKNIWLSEFNDEAEQTNAWLTSLELCDSLLKDHKAAFEELIAQQFDSIVVDDLYNPAGLLITSIKKSVFVYWSVSGLRTESAYSHQSPSPPSYLPVPGSKLTDTLDFFQRNFNLASYIRQLYLHQHIILRRMDALFEKHYPNQLTEAFYMERNASINFVNTPPIFDFARPYMPRVNFVGALHCHKARQLSKDLQDFIQKKDKFVVISGGFSVQWKYASKSQIDAIIEMTNSLKHLNFVWQYNGPAIKNLPSNVFIQSWIPQQDLLGHAKCVLHISHGGLNSVVESVWHGVPVLGLPLTVKSYDNLLRVSDRGAGLILEKDNWNTPSLVKSAKDLIENPSFKEEMTLFQDMVVDVPYTELEHASFWVEFIVRHQEVPHARSGADKLNILQYFMVDVISFLAAIFITSVAISYFLLKAFVRGIVCLYNSFKAGTSDVDKNKAVSHKKKQN